MRVRRPRGSRRPPFVSVIVVNYNGKHFLKRCLESLAAQTYPEDRREVILVDNGSSDGSAEYVREQFPWVRVIRASTNWGFAKGNNIGLQHARGDLIALLNNDAVAGPAWLSAMTRALQQGLTVGGVTSKILFLHQPGVINSAGLDLYRDGRGGDRGFRQPDRGQFDRPTEVFGACGASMLVRRAMIDDVGFFDESFGMYYEDLDLAWRGGCAVGGFTTLQTRSSITFTAGRPANGRRSSSTTSSATACSPVSRMARRGWLSVRWQCSLPELRSSGCAWRPGSIAGRSAVSKRLPTSLPASHWPGISPRWF